MQVSKGRSSELKREQGISFKEADSSLKHPPHIFTDGTPPSGKLVGSIVNQAELTLEMRNQMWMLYSFYYDNGSYDSFIADLNEKNYVCLLRDKGNQQIKGFSTIKVYEETYRKKPITVIFSGDTIVDSEYWGQKALHTQLFKFFVSLKLKNGLKPVYWFLISKGYKTYLGMTRNFLNYWPRHDQAKPDFVAEIIESLATDRYGDSWNPELGVLKFDQCPGKLKDKVAPIDENLLLDPDINFFHKSNPGHGDGDELCCLAEVSFSLFAYYPYRLIKKSFRRFKKKKKPAFNRKPAYSSQ